MSVKVGSEHIASNIIRTAAFNSIANKLTFCLVRCPLGQYPVLANYCLDRLEFLEKPFHMRPEWRQDLAVAVQYAAMNR